MFDILVYLFENYAHSESKITIDCNSLINDLLDIGFQQSDIYRALRWLKNLSFCKKSIMPSVFSEAKEMSIRVYTKDEMIKFNSDCRGFIIFLEQLKILTLDTREMIIERVMELDVNELSLEDLKWIILIVLFNVSGCEDAYRQLKNLLIYSCTEVIH